VETTRRTHEFHLQAEASLMAAYLVQLQFGPRQQPEAQVQLAPSEQRWSYKIRGDRQVRPADIMDDGAKTWISFADGQPLPAIFAIGPSGKEQVVNGYMRGDQFVIDRVHEQLIFRIDKKKAQARRGAAMELGG
jgi:type IV secretion system protein VirB9